MIVARLLLAIVVLALAGCVSITSEPPGASVYRRGELIGKTPYETGLAPGPFWQSTGEIRVELPGYVIDSVKLTGGDMHFILRRGDQLSR